MIAIGEESGNLDEMLRDISMHYDDEVEYAVERMAAAITPILTVGLAGIVLFFAMSIFLPLFDLTKMAQSPVKEKALADPELLASVVAFKQRFYPRGWARYDLAKPGTLVLVPEGHVLASVRSDYRAMENMIFGEMPHIDQILGVLQALQEEINV